MRRQVRANALKSTLAGIVGVVASVRSLDSPFGHFVDGFLMGETPRVRHCGDLLPIPRVITETVMSLIPDAKDFAVGLTTLANFSLAGCNFLYGGMRAIAVPSNPTGAQRHAHAEILSKWWSLIRHASNSDDFISSIVSSPFFATSVAAQRTGPAIVADRVDGISKCGQVDSALWLPSEAQQLFNSEANLFPDGLVGVPVTVAFKGGSRLEYAKLVCAQLMSRKVALMQRPSSSAGIFMVAKKDKSRLREVWDGSLISSASAEPTTPRWVADPSALIALESSWDRPIYVSTRDGACFFDQLLLPTPLCRFFGRPQISVGELVKAGLPIAELRDYLIDGDGLELDDVTLLAPVSLTWPMGFAHSAYVAQQIMTEACLLAGFSENQFLSSAGSIPDPLLPCVTVAIDDVNAFVRLSREERVALQESPLADLDEVWAEINIIAKQEKSSDLSRSGVMLGVELVNGMQLHPKRKRFGSLFGGLLDLLTIGMTSPRALHEYLGVLQWACLANRGMLSCFSGVYEFVERLPCAGTQRVPDGVLDELCVCVSLMGYLNVDLTRPWAAQVVATDGAQDYGFGMAASSCHPSWTRRMAGHCSESGQGIIPAGVDIGSASVRAVQDPLHIPYAYDDFVPYFSVRAKVRDDAPTMEAIAIALAMRRVTRSVRHHGHRHVFLLDAQALIYALRKGRSSSRAFKVQLQKVGALTVCAGILPYYGYIPTACNLGDPPSRGIKRSLERFRKIQSVCSSWQQHCQSLRQSARFVRAWRSRHGHAVLRYKGSYDSSSSDSRTAQPEAAW